MPKAGSGSSAKAKANAGGNKKAKAASTQKKTKAKAGGKQASTLAAVSGPDLSQMKRRLNRRDTDEQASRTMQAKFYEQGYSQTVVESLRNSRGESIQDVVSEEIRMTRGKKKYLTTAFWRRVYSEFELKKGMFGKLPEQPEYMCSEELEESLLPAYDENVTTRPPK